MTEPINPMWQDLNQRLTQCRTCTRLVAWRESVAANKKRVHLNEPYWGKPVPGFGDPQARILVVGLAPGAHGSNRTGRMFTGDASGNFLFPALFRAGFANQPSAIAKDDGLLLTDLFITAVGRCAPPDNKPAPEELNACQPFLLQEINLLSRVEGVVALGRVAFERLLRIYRPDAGSYSSYEFYHGAFYALNQGKTWLLASYHPSRQNTQTGRLTVEMFDAIWLKVNQMLTH